MLVLIPVLAIYGGKDTQVPAAQNAAALRATLPSAEIVVLPSREVNFWFDDFDLLDREYDAFAVIALGSPSAHLLWVLRGARDGLVLINAGHGAADAVQTPHVVNPSFQRRSSAKVSTTSWGSRPSRCATAARMAGASVRRNGLQACSLASVVGSVDWPWLRWVRASAVRCWRSALPGSTVSANAALASVYSWPQHTWVVSGSAPNRDSEACICAGVPSNMRPQPRLNSVSPQNTSPWPWKAMC